MIFRFGFMLVTCNFRHGRKTLSQRNQSRFLAADRQFGHDDHFILRDGEVELGVYYQRSGSVHEDFFVLRPRARLEQNFLRKDQSAPRVKFNVTDGKTCKIADRKSNRSAVPRYEGRRRTKAGVADGIRTRNNKLHKLGLYR
jgi:hypothetical protein